MTALFSRLVGIIQKRSGRACNKKRAHTFSSDRYFAFEVREREKEDKRKMMNSLVR